jgi:hypothetical protein
MSIEWHNVRQDVMLTLEPITLNPADHQIINANFIAAASETDLPTATLSTADLGASRR